MTSCSSANKNVQSDSSSTSQNGEKVSLYAVNGKVINEGGYYGKELKDKNLVFRSRLELDSFINSIVKVSYYNPNFLMNQMKKYTPSWFNEHLLFYTTKEQNTGSIKYTLKGMEKHISANGKRTVVIHVEEYCPFLVTADMAYFCFFVEMNRADVEDVPNEDFSLDF
jgi:hypothetical protein